MSRRRLSLLSALSTLLLLTVFPSPAFADEYVCDDLTEKAPAVVDNLKVPDDATCTLVGTTVDGTIKVEKGATLDATDVEVAGNIQADGHDDVTVSDSTVGGSIQIKQGGSASITAVMVNGDIQFDHSTGPLVASLNRVGGSIQVVGNDGSVVISTNTMKGNLQCKENNPGPAGGGNTVGGNAEDQCATLGGGPVGSTGSTTTGSTPSGSTTSVLGARAGFARLWLMNGPSFFLQIL